MRKTLIVLSLFAVCVAFSCKKESDTQQQEAVLAKKYAKYRVIIRKEAEMKNWAATLEKGEDVDLLQEFESVDKDGKKITVAKVRLTDGVVGFVESRHLADKVIVFIGETPAYIRPTVGSKVHCKIPKGTIAFVVGEQANWKKIYAGKIGNVWVTEQWVQDGYSTDPQLLRDARMYEMAVEQLAAEKDSEKVAAKQKLVELSQGDGIFAGLAQEKLAAIESQSEKDQSTEQEATK
ncbi:MAG: lipoprotein LenA [Spirochaetes bacterium]|nr:lipoprotein LenA [Spirochaetota bacterium]